MAVIGCRKYLSYLGLAATLAFTVSVCPPAYGQSVESDPNAENITIYNADPTQKHQIVSSDEDSEPSIVSPAPQQGFQTAQPAAPAIQDGQSQVIINTSDDVTSERADIDLSTGLEPAPTQSAPQVNAANNSQAPDEDSLQTEQPSDSSRGARLSPTGEYSSITENYVTDPNGDRIPIFDMRGDDGVLMDFRPSGLAFLSRNRILVSDEANQQLHIFDTEGRRFRRLVIPRVLSQPRYSGLCNLEDNKFFVVGSHFHVNNNVRFLWARGVLHYYELRNERLTDNSAKNNYDPEMAWRNTGYFGENNNTHVKVEGIACNPVEDAIYFGVSQPVNKDESVLVYKASLNGIIERNKKLRFEVHPTNLAPGLDASINEPFILTDIFHVPDRGLLFLVSSKTADERTNGTSQIWFQADGSTEPRLIADGIAPGNFATGIAAYKVGNTYNIGLVFDNNPAQNDIPSRFLLLEDVSI